MCAIETDGDAPKRSSAGGTVSRIWQPRLVVLIVALLLLVPGVYQLSIVSSVNLDASEHQNLPAFLESRFVISHRGSLAECPENTFTGIVYAYEHGIRLIEVDVRMTADKVPILMHDPSLERTTNGTGLVEDVTWDYIRTLEAGSFFSDEFAGEGVPRVSDVFAWLSERPDLFMWVHLRFERGDEIMSDLIDACSVQSQVVIQVDAHEVERQEHFQNCLGRACIIKEPLLPMVSWSIPMCASYNVQFLTIIDDLDSKSLYDVTDPAGMKVVLTRNFDADMDHVISRLSGDAWGYVFNSAVTGGEAQRILTLSG